MRTRWIRLVALGVLAACTLLLYSRPLPRQVAAGAADGQGPYRFHNYDYLYDYEYGLQHQALEAAGPQKNIVLGAVLPSEDDPVCRRFAEGLRQEAKRREVGMLVEYSGGDTESERQIVQRFMQNSLDAVILYPLPGAGQAALFRSIKQENTPLVAVWQQTDTMCLDLVDTFVGPDDTQVGQELAAWALVNWPSSAPVLVIGQGEEDTFAASCVARLESFGSGRTVSRATAHSLPGVLGELAGDSEVLVLCRDTDVETALAADTDAVVRLAVCGEDEAVQLLLQEGRVLGGISYSAAQDAAAAVEGALLAAGGEKGEFRVRSPLQWSQLEAGA